MVGRKRKRDESYRRVNYRVSGRQRNHRLKLLRQERNGSNSDYIGSRSEPLKTQQLSLRSIGFLPTPVLES